MADTFDANSFDWGSSGLFGFSQFTSPIVNAKLKVFGTLKPEGFNTTYLNDAVNYSIFGGGTMNRIPSQEEYEKAFQKIKDNPSDYYKLAVQSAAKTLGHNTSLYDYFGGQVDPIAYKEAPQNNYKNIATEAIEKGYLTADEIKSISTPAYEQAYTKQSGYNNPDLRGGSSFFDKTLGAITSNPLTTLAFPVVGAAALGAFSAPAVAGTDYLGTQALGSAETGAVGTGSTGFGVNAAAPSIGINSGTGSLLATAPVDSGFGISTTAPAGNFGEFNPNIGSGVSGSSGIGIDTGAAANIEYLGGASSLPAGTAGLTAEQLASAGGALSDAAATSGLGYLGGAEALPTGTAGLTTTVPAESAITPTEAIRGAQLANTLLAGTPSQPTQTPKNVAPRGVVSYDPLLSLLTMKASRPNILSLLG